MFVLGYECWTAAGFGVEDLMAALYAGRDASQPNPHVKGRWCPIDSLQDSSRSYRERFLDGFRNICQSKSFSSLLRDVPELQEKRVGLVFSSTKGCVEDFIWNLDESAVRTHPGPYEPIVTDLIELLKPVKFTYCRTVSNACSSSHVALCLIKDLFSTDHLDFVFFVAGDLLGPFVSKGFESLKLFSQTSNQPFSDQRDGLQLGEALTIVLLSKRPRTSGDFKIVDVSTQTEGAAITRPVKEGRGLVRALTSMEGLKKGLPDFVVAHGTGTQFNDSAEDFALSTFWNDAAAWKIPVTGTKWSVGHCLGASGAVDLIAACEILKEQRLFALGNTSVQDPKFKMSYLTQKFPMGEALSERAFNLGLVTSLGFGGVQAALLVQRVVENGH